MTSRKPMTKTRALREAQMWLTLTPPRVRKFRLVGLTYVPIAIAARLCVRRRAGLLRLTGSSGRGAG